MFKAFRILICSVFIFSCGTSFAAQQKTVSLPQPDKIGGKPLMEALNLRHSQRNISAKTLSAQELSNLLWAVWGANRSDGRRTAPTGRNSQKVEVYAVLADGVWLYDGVKNELVQAMNSDERSKYTPAGVTLLYAADIKDDFAGMHVGSLYQNAGLYCASAGLANVVKASGKDALKGKLPLPKNYEVLMIQSIGYEAEK
ncbi:MAG: nitroreductase family protein [Endomicrobium sp.]|nr:nitroreductase family protein [Endomicrobium sp.]